MCSKWKLQVAWRTWLCEQRTTQEFTVEIARFEQPYVAMPKGDLIQSRKNQAPILIVYCHGPQFFKNQGSLTPLRAELYRRK